MRSAVALLVASSLLAASTSQAAPTSSSAHLVYVYQKGHEWCAALDLKTFKREAEAASANAFAVDEGKRCARDDRTFAWRRHCRDQRKCRKQPHEGSL